MKTITVHVEVSRDDYVEAWAVFSRLYPRGDPWKPIRYLGIAFVAVGVIVVAAGRPWAVAVGLLAVGGFQIACAVNGAAAEVQRYWSNYLRAVEPMTWVFGPDGATATTPLTSAAFAWAAFDGFRTSPNLVILTRPTMAFILPKRSFADADTLLAFREMLKARILPKARGFDVVPGRKSPASSDGDAN